MAVRLWEVREQGIVKSKRQAKMIEIIEQNEIETQDELAERLMEAGFVATQATISRDIRELKLTKVSDGNGKQKYIWKFFKRKTKRKIIDPKGNGKIIICI